MAGTSRSYGVGETSVSELRETLQAQQQLLQALYAELDEEREASATATSEALSMILRLQGEKAAVKMEASQYKRMAEEKMCHAETSLAIFEELYSEREMEIANLEYQVEAYRCKLLSMGCDDFGTYESKFPENLLLQASDQTPAGGNMRRLRSLSSLPPVPSKHSPKKSSIERKTSMSDMISKIVEQSGDQERVSQSLKLVRKSREFGIGNFDSYWNQIRQLEEQVKRISDGKEPEGKKNVNADGWKFCSLLDEGSTDVTPEQSRQTSTANLNPVNHRCPWGGDSALSSSNCLDVYEVFEAPQAKTDENDEAWEQLKKKHDKSNLESDDRLKKTDNFEKRCEIDIPFETDNLKNMLFRTKSDCQKNTMTVFEKTSEEISVGCNVPPTVSSRSNLFETQDELQKLYQRIKHLEGVRNSARCEIRPSRGEGDLKLLKEIKEQLNAVESKMRSRRKVKDTPLENEVSLLPLQEAMLYFWM